jgi:hypothetical protein
MTGRMIALILAVFVVVVGLLSYNRRQAGPAGGRATIATLVGVVIVAGVLLFILSRRHGG